MSSESVTGPLVSASSSEEKQDITVEPVSVGSGLLMPPVASSSSTGTSFLSPPPPLSVPQTVGASSSNPSVAVPPPHEPARINWGAPLERRILSLLDGENLTDVEFVVGNAQERMRAHKLILAVSSPVFYSMFFSASFTSESVVRLPDCDPDAFRTLLQFIYGNGYVNGPESDFNGETLEAKILPVLYVAHKYDVKGLEELCALRLCLALNPWNVLSMLHLAELYDLEGLLGKCWSLIQVNTRSVLNFHQHSLDYATLLRIVQDNALSISEVKLFEFLNSWAENECEKQEIVPTIDNKLRRLGETLSFIRFPIMSHAEFADRVVPKGLLSQEHVAQIFTYICSSPQNRTFLRVDFPTNRRGNCVEDFIFNGFNPSPQNNNPMPSQPSQAGIILSAAHRMSSSFQGSGGQGPAHIFPWGHHQIPCFLGQSQSSFQYNGPVMAEVRPIAPVGMGAVRGSQPNQFGTFPQFSSPQPQIVSPQRPERLQGPSGGLRRNVH